MQWMLAGFLAATLVSALMTVIVLIWERQERKRNAELQALRHLLSLQKDAEREAKGKAFKALKTAETRWWKHL